MTRQEMEWALFGLSREGAPGGGDAEAMRRDIMAEFDRMRPVYDAAMAYVREVCAHEWDRDSATSKLQAMIDYSWAVMQDED